MKVYYAALSKEYNQLNISIECIPTHSNRLQHFLDKILIY